MARSDAHLPIIPDTATAPTPDSRFAHDFSSIPVHPPGNTDEQQESGSFLDQIKQSFKGIYKSLGGGGEVDNNTDTSFLVSGVDNSDQSDFFVLSPNTNSDDVPAIVEGLDGDVDAVWPNGTAVKASASGIEFSSGAFKLNDTQNTAINGDKKSGYVITSYERYYPGHALPPGWHLPDVLRK